jgi:hypothetical protein
VRVQASVVVLGLAIAVPAVAQVRDPNQQVADQQQATQKTQMRTYELILRQAVEHGGQEFAVWTDQVAPGLLLASVSPPIISSIPVPGRGIVFDIQIPEIIPMQNKFLTEMIRRQPQAPPQQTVPGTPTQPTSGRVQGTNGQMTPDLMKTSPAGSPSMDANQRYSEYVRTALIDAILDNIGVLTLKDDETLTVGAMGIDVANTNPLYANTSRKLILHVMGSDMNLFRQGKITRDELRDRIIEKHF